MTSWGFPSYVAVPFSLVSQVLFIILGFKPPYLCRRCLRNHYIKFGEKLTPPEAKKWFSTPPSCQTEVGEHIVYVKGIPVMPLLEKLLGNGDYSFNTHRYRFPCDFHSKSPRQENRNPRARVYLQNSYENTPNESSSRQGLQCRSCVPTWWVLHIPIITHYNLMNPIPKPYFYFISFIYLGSSKSTLFTRTQELLQRISFHLHLQISSLLFIKLIL